MANQVSRLKNVTVHQPELAHAAGGGGSQWYAPPT